MIFVTPICVLLVLSNVYHSCQAMPSKASEESNPLQQLLGSWYNRNSRQLEQATQEVSQSDEMRSAVPSVTGTKSGSKKPGINALREAFSEMSDEDLSAFTPPPVTNPQCYVEVEVVQRFPGKCVMLGGRIPGCQAQKWLSVYSEDCVAPPTVSVNKSN